jgi:dienelactone hydrolase
MQKFGLQISTIYYSVILFLCLWTQAALTQQAPAAGTTVDAPKPAESQSTKVVKKGSKESGEDWGSISIAGSNLPLQAMDPLPDSVEDDDPQFTREFMQVQWRVGDPLDLYVIKPKGVAKAPAILYLYSYPSHTDPFKDDNFARMVTKNGVAAVGFVLALNDHRYHSRSVKEWFVSELQESLATSTHDVQMVLNYLATRGDIDMDRIGMFGDGAGGTVAILAAATDPRIRTLDLLDPWGDWPDWLAKSTLVPDDERAAYLKPEFLDRVAPLDPVKWLPELKSRAVHLQVVGDITVTPKIAMDRMLATAPSNVQITRYPDSHTFIKEAGIGGKAFDWIQAQVRSPGATPPPGHSAGSSAKEETRNSGLSAQTEKPRAEKSER